MKWKIWQQRPIEDEWTTNPMMRALEARLRRALRPGKRVMVLLVGVIIALCLVIAQLEYYHFAHPTTNKIVANGIANCQANNTYRAAQTMIWQSYNDLQATKAKHDGAELAKLILVLADGDPKKVAAIKAILATTANSDAVDTANFLRGVALTNAPRNCAAANQVPGVPVAGS